ncbi:MAG TPA: FkbM family methyltransferase [Pyrinomonadaceae bacterium]|jgi:FkbM family methyltransferase
MYKNILSKVIGLYLFPFKPDTRLYHYVKDRFFTGSTEHLYRAIRHIKKSGRETAGSIIIDVGGFDGGTSLYFAEQFEHLEIYCIEPNSRMIPQLKKVEASEPRIHVRNMALGERRGEARLHVTSNNVSSSINELNLTEIGKQPPVFQGWLAEEAAENVRVSTLDDEFKDEESVLLIKLDTQGTELDVLKGGIETLRRTSFILTEMNNHEMYKNACQYYEVDAFLRAHSFRLVDIVVTYRSAEGLNEFDALYERQPLGAGRRNP